MTYSKRPQVGFELEFGPPVHRVAPHEQAVSCSFFYLCLLCFLMFLLACLFFVSTSSCCFLFPFISFFFLFFYSNRALTDVIVNGGQSSKDLSNINILIEVIAAHLSKGTRAEKQIIISHQIRSLLRTEVLCWTHQSLEERLCVSNTKDTNQRICS